MQTLQAPLISPHHLHFGQKYFVYFTLILNFIHIVSYTKYNDNNSEHESWVETMMSYMNVCVHALRPAYMI
jgi:hypothetical protein